MSQSQDFLTTQAFADKAGVSSGTVSKWLRSGKIEGQKKNGKWIIAEDEISKIAKPAPKQARGSAAPQAKPATKPAAPKPDGSAYTVESFCRMTYLTEFGVRLWLRTGRLISATDGSGGQGIDAASLDLPHVKPLLR